MGTTEETYKFDAESYVQYLFEPENKTVSKHLLEHLAKFYGSLSCGSGSLTILDYGCGPCLPYSISAAPKASEIVLADYAKSSRDHLREWLDGGDSAYDWTPCFQHVVQVLEGGSEEEAKQRQHLLRSKVKAVISCDINRDDFIDERYMVKYDVVMSFICLDGSVRDLDGYKSGIAKLSSLIKDNG